MTKLARTIASISLLAAVAAWPFAAKAQFADQATFVATPGGTANAITLPVANWTRNLPGVVIRFVPAAVNTGATTIIVNGVGSPIPVKKTSGAGLIALSGGELAPSQIAEVAFDGTQFELLTAPPLPQKPQGYLTPCQVSSPSPVSGCQAGQYLPTGDVTAATTLYYENGAAVPINNGGQFVATPVTEAQGTLILSTTANLASHIYDVCIYNNGGTPAIGTMPGWSTFTAGTGARGSAAAIEVLNGVWVNSLAATVTNNNVGVAVPAKSCTIVATILIDAANGQVSFTKSYGQNRKWSVWNFYNRQTITLQGGDPNATPWETQDVTIRACRNDPNNRMTTIIGLPEEAVSVTIVQVVGIRPTGGAGATRAGIGVGINSTTATVGKRGQIFFSTAAIGAQNPIGTDVVARYVKPPTIGSDNIQCVEYNDFSSPGSQFFGTSANMMMTVSWNG